MALWKEITTSAPTGHSSSPSPPIDRPTPEPSPPPPPPAVRKAREPVVDGGDSMIAANITIEGKIEGSGNVRIAGRFKGDVRIDGNFNIEPGAHLTGQVLAGVVVVGGELQGNIESAKRVDVLDGGVIVGDVKAGSITVAAGSRMRGHVEFGWGDEKPPKLDSGR